MFPKLLSRTLGKVNISNNTKMTNYLLKLYNLMGKGLTFKIQLVRLQLLKIMLTLGDTNSALVCGCLIGKKSLENSHGSLIQSYKEVSEISLFH